MLCDWFDHVRGGKCLRPRQFPRSPALIWDYRSFMADGTGLTIMIGKRLRAHRIFPRRDRPASRDATLAGITFRASPAHHRCHPVASGRARAKSTSGSSRPNRSESEHTPLSQGPNRRLLCPCWPGFTTNFVCAWVLIESYGTGAREIGSPAPPPQIAGCRRARRPAGCCWNYRSPPSAHGVWALSSSFHCLHPGRDQIGALCVFPTWTCTWRSIIILFGDRGLCSFALKEWGRGPGAIKFKTAPCGSAVLALLMRTVGILRGSANESRAESFEARCHGSLRHAKSQFVIRISCRLIRVSEDPGAWEVPRPGAK